MKKEHQTFYLQNVESIEDVIEFMIQSGYTNEIALGTVIPLFEKEKAAVITRTVPCSFAYIIELAVQVRAHENETFTANEFIDMLERVIDASDKIEAIYGRPPKVGVIGIALPKEGSNEGPKFFFNPVVDTDLLMSKKDKAKDYTPLEYVNSHFFNLYEGMPKDYVDKCLEDIFKEAKEDWVSVN